jgi:hypothetical protein
MKPRNVGETRSNQIQLMGRLGCGCLFPFSSGTIDGHPNNVRSPKIYLEFDQERRLGAGGEQVGDRYAQWRIRFLDSKFGNDW